MLLRADEHTAVEQQDPVPKRRRENTFQRGQHVRVRMRVPHALTHIQYRKKGADFS